MQKFNLKILQFLKLSLSLMGLIRVLSTEMQMVKGFLFRLMRTQTLNKLSVKFVLCKIIFIIINNLKNCLFNIALIFFQRFHFVYN
ncbi:hypothetical protein C8R28_104527 [Nitrosomonas ureae]|uniref:Uncharacterized protein n=1 Tax=Nitrosomonas ureae TaxID=44577 RepID=A0A2T5I7J3_9PROT|nr:hypothetical protein C8R28_104527 [Nitrosomonas ureae]